MAVAAHYGATVAWHCEFDKHPSGILAHHYPDIPNHHDVTSVDWAAVEPVDILTGGYPCQPFSHAGTRKGTNDERHLWPYVADSLRVLRPRLAVLENVAGHLSLGFDTVLADLAALGFDAEWVVVRASDAGAPHRRERLFIVAADAARERGDGGWYAGPRRWAELADGGGDADGLTLLPTPAVNDMGRGKTVEDWDAWTDAMRARHGNGNGHGKSLEIEAQRLLPTPKASDGPNGGPGMRNGRGVADALPGVVGQLLPTPTASDARDGQYVRQMTLDAIERGASKGVNLNHLVEGALPPGAFRCCRRRRRVTGRTGRHDPTRYPSTGYWDVPCGTTSARTLPPSTAGRPSSAAPHRRPPSLAATAARACRRASSSS